MSLEIAQVADALLEFLVGGFQEVLAQVEFALALLQLLAALAQPLEQAAFGGRNRLFDAAWNGSRQAGLAVGLAIRLGRLRGVRLGFGLCILLLGRRGGRARRFRVGHDAGAAQPLRDVAMQRPVGRSGIRRQVDHLQQQQCRRRSRNCREKPAVAQIHAASLPRAVAASAAPAQAALCEALGRRQCCRQTALRLGCGRLWRGRRRRRGCGGCRAGLGCARSTARASRRSGRCGRSRRRRSWICAVRSCDCRSAFARWPEMVWSHSRDDVAQARDRALGASPSRVDQVDDGLAHGLLVGLDHPQAAIQQEAIADRRGEQDADEESR